jgi:homocitrate synthase
MLLAHVRCHPNDIEQALRARVDGLNIYMGASERTQQSGHGKTLDEMVRYVRNTVEDVRRSNPDLYMRYSVEDAFNTRPDSIMAYLMWRTNRSPPWEFLTLSVLPLLIPLPH